MIHRSHYLSMVNADTQTILFYGWWQLAVCFFAFLALMAIWWHIETTKGFWSSVAGAVHSLPEYLRWF